MNQSGHTESLTILGRGRVGMSLHRAARRAGCDVKLLPGATCLDGEAADHRLLILAVPADAIAEVCERQIAAGIRPPAVAHLDGSRGRGELASAFAAGVETVALHPLQTFTGPVTELDGVPCAVTASASAWDRMSSLLRALGMRPFAVDDESRALYHAAASMASNFLVALEESAASLMRSAGVEAPRDALAPLVLASAGNWGRLGADALTGPIARGDEATVARHRESISGSAPRLLPLYDALADQARAAVAGVPG